LSRTRTERTRDAAGGLFGYTEPTLRAPVVIAIAAEAAAIVLLVAYLVARPAPARARVDWSTA